MLQKIRKVHWKRGSDTIGFALILPGLCFILYAIIVISQLCLCRQTLEYALYEGSRAAVICEDYGSGLEAMDSVVKSTLKDSTFGIADDGIHVNIQLVAGTTDATGAEAGAIKWEKGALALCTVDVKINKLLELGGDTMHASIYVMVERPARIY